MGVGKGERGQGQGRESKGIKEREREEGGKQMESTLREREGPAHGDA